METSWSSWSIKVGLCALALGLAQPLAAAQPATPAASSQRSAGAIARSVQAAMQADPQLRKRNIAASADSDGRVTLTGFVTTQEQKDHATAVAEGVAGVTSVDNALAIGKSSGASATDSAKQTLHETGQAVSDDWITTKVKSQLLATGVGVAVHVETSNHVVTLTGTVPSDAERQKAASIARTTDGVADVVDQIRLAPARAK